MKQSRIPAVCRIVLSVLFVPALVLSMVCVGISAVFNANAVEKQLQKEEFYTFAMQQISENVTSLQGVINLSDRDFIAAVPKEEIEPLLQNYTTTISKHLLEGDTDTPTVTYRSDSLYQLVCTVITPDQYNGDTKQMEADRMDAYTDLVTEIDNTLNFFPQSLYKTVTDIFEKNGFRLQDLYAFLKIVRTAALPLVAVTVLLGLGIFLCAWQDKAKGLRTVAGCTFITSAVFFMLTVFLRNYSLLDRLSLSDGLLRRYILAIFHNAGDAVFTTVTVVFCIGTALLLGSIAWTVISSAKNTCTAAENMVE